MSKDKEFVLRITLENDAMSTYPDLADTLEAIATNLNAEGPEECRRMPARKILDQNGNTVGSWRIE